MTSTSDLIKKAYAAGQAQKRRGGKCLPTTYFISLPGYLALDVAIGDKIIAAYRDGYAAELRRNGGQ